MGRYVDRSSHMEMRRELVGAEMGDFYGVTGRWYRRNVPKNKLKLFIYQKPTHNPMIISTTTKLSSGTRNRPEISFHLPNPRHIKIKPPHLSNKRISHASLDHPHGSHPRCDPYHNHLSDATFRFHNFALVPL